MNLKPMELSSQQTIHETYMRRCLELARHAEGLTLPNPMVGAVVVYQNRIIGEGYHRKAGGPHAEVWAIESVKDQTLLKESTLYVNLEPCAHFGKTPPCSLLIQQKKIPRVVIGCTDSYSEVSGRGITMLKASGAEVVLGILEKESRELNRRFFTFHEQKRPYIILKWASTQDGFIDINREETTENRPTWITNEHARRMVHLWRSREPAILVGSITALKDNPSLTVRDWAGSNPVRIVLDRNGSLPANLSLFNDEAPTMVFTSNENSSFEYAEKILMSYNANPVDTILETLYQRGVQSVIVEGGAQLLNAFIDMNLWDEARVFKGPQWFIKGVNEPHISGTVKQFEKFGCSSLFVFRNNL